MNVCVLWWKTPSPLKKEMKKVLRYSDVIRFSFGRLHAAMENPTTTRLEHDHPSNRDPTLVIYFHFMEPACALLQVSDVFHRPLSRIITPLLSPSLFAHSKCVS